MSSAGLVDRERPPIAARPWSRERILGVLLLAAWAAAGLGLAGYLVSAWNPELIARYGPSYLSGLGVTLSLVALSIVFGAVLSLPVAYARASQNRVLAVVSYAYVYFFRGTPLIAQTLPGLLRLRLVPAELEAVGLWCFFRDAWNCAVFAFALNTAAYQAEILRGAIESVPRGQWEGAAALGLTRLQTLWKVDPAAGADRGAAPLRQRDHPDDQGLGDRRHHHRLRSDGRDALRLLAQLRLPDLSVGRPDLSHHRRGAAPLD